jgi:3-oxoacyl-[acyl-carrier protein] reductase
MRLQDKVAVITGAGQGIGRAYALRFVQEGARVVLADIQEGNALRVAQEVQDAGGAGMAVETDVADPASVRNLVGESLGRFGRIDVLVNNAAISSGIQHKPFEEITLPEWDRLMAVNLTGSFLCCQAVVPHMRRRQHGRIINISSAVARRAGPWRYAHYVTSKAGILGLTRALASELGDDHITVNAISPGPVETELSKGAPVSEQMKTLIAAQVIHRREVPDDLVGVAVFLASEDARFITGQVINVDGGLNFN